MTEVRKPDTVLVAVTRVDGGLTMLRVVTTEYRPTTEEEKAAGLGNRIANWTVEPTDDRISAVIAKHAWAGPLAPVGWRRVADDFVDESTDRTFRDAWKDGNGKPDVDMPKAREIHKENLRVMRQPLLDALDMEYMKADEQGKTAEKRAIANKKQALRDVTDDPRIEGAQTPDELKAVIPEALVSG